MSPKGDFAFLRELAKAAGKLRKELHRKEKKKRPPTAAEWHGAF